MAPPLGLMEAMLGHAGFRHLELLQGKRVPEAPRFAVTLDAVDLRGLDPPEPLLRILADLDAGGPGPFAYILAREPLPLYPLLAAAGWRHATARGEEGFVLRVFRNAAIP